MLPPACPACNGSGCVAEEAVSGGLVCDGCNGTGSAAAWRLMRAYRLGVEHGMEAMVRAMPSFERGENCHGLWDLWRAVTEDEEDARVFSGEG